jgi:hypothetical protein
MQAAARQRFLDPLKQGPLGKIAKQPDGLGTTTQRAMDALFPESPLPGSQDEVATAVHALVAQGPRGQWAAQQLVRGHVEQKLNEAFDASKDPNAAQFAGAGATKNIVGSPVVPGQKFENVTAAVNALGNGAGPGVQRFFDIAQATGWRAPIGSRTAFNEQDLHALGTGSMVGNIAKTAASPERWWNGAHDIWTKFQLGQNLDGLARVITDPNAAPIFRRIAQLPPNSREAQILAARLTMQAGSQGFQQRKESGQ